MTQFSTPEPLSLSGQVAFDRQGEEIGTIGGVYVDDDTEEPEWAAVDLGSDIALVPLVGATGVAGGVQLAYDTEEIEDAPHRRSRLSRALTQEDEADLYAYYGLRASPGRRRAQRASRSTRAHAKEAGKEAASTAVEQGQRVASTAVDHGQQVASRAVGQSQEVARAARRQARDVAGTAREQAGEVTQELAEQARGLMEQTKSQLQDQAETQSERLAESLRRLGGELQALVEGRPSEAGTVGDYARQAAEKLIETAEAIESKGPEGVLDDLKALARDRPGAFVLGAALAGLAVGRLARSGGGDDGGAQTAALPVGRRRSPAQAPAPRRSSRTATAARRRTAGTGGR